MEYPDRVRSFGGFNSIAAVVLIAVAVFAGIHHAINDGTHPASDKLLATTGVAPNGAIKPPSTTGFGGSSPQPIAVRPVASAHP